MVRRGFHPWFCARIGFYNPFGFTHLNVDVFGYFTAPASPFATSSAGDLIEHHSAA